MELDAAKQLLSNSVNVFFWLSVVLCVPALLCMLVDYIYTLVKKHKVNEIK